MKLFRTTAFSGFCASAIAFVGMLGFSALPMSYDAAKSLSRLFVLLAVIGLAASAVAVYLGRRDKRLFSENKRAFVAAYTGLSMSLLLLLLGLLRLV